MAARRFLYIFAGLIFLLISAGLLWTMFSQTIMRFTFVPTVSFASSPQGRAPDYDEPQAWLSRPGARDDPATWLPPGIAKPSRTDAVVFFIPPSTYLEKGLWNAPYTDPSMDKRARVILPVEVSAFTNVARIWAPRYREATLGAFLTTGPDATKALNLAYSDVERAFDAFQRQAPPAAPIILAAHSQGSFHLLRLLSEKIATNKTLKKRIVAAYVVGWPISTSVDLPALGLPACIEADQIGCVLSWESFAEPADPEQLRVRYDASIGLTGVPRRGTPALCVNPLTGTQDGHAPASANLGTLQPTRDYTSATLIAHLLPARCDQIGLLVIGPPPDGFGVAVLPGNNYHVFDYALFWSNIRADAARRLLAFESHGP